MSARGYRLVDNEDQPLLEVGAGDRCRILASAANGARHLTVAERWLDPGAVVAEHRHPAGIEEALWVRAGRLEVVVAGETAELPAGTTVVIPPLQAHRLRSLGPEAAVLFCRYSAAQPLTLSDSAGIGPPELPGT